MLDKLSVLKHAVCDLIFQKNQARRLAEKYRDRCVKVLDDPPEKNVLLWEDWDDGEDVE